jgi:hypothetical protein
VDASAFLLKFLIIDKSDENYRTLFNLSGGDVIPSPHVTSDQDSIKNRLDEYGLCKHR